MKEFLMKMFSSNDNVSSKRVIGIVCIFSTILMVITAIVLKFEITSSIENLVSSIYWGGIMLLGIGVTEKFIK